MYTKIDNDILCITGKDAKRFLQNLMTNDINNLDYIIKYNESTSTSFLSKNNQPLNFQHKQTHYGFSSTFNTNDLYPKNICGIHPIDMYKNNVVSYAIYSTILDNKGRFIFGFFISKMQEQLLSSFKLKEESYLIEIDKKDTQKLLNHLLLYKLNSNVEIISLNDYYVLYTHVLNDEYFRHAIKIYKDPRYKDLGYKVLINQFHLKACNNIYKPQLYMDDKYKYAICDGSDLTVNKSIPIEYGFEELGAISYHKGCYVGQEIIARAKYYGEVRKKIFYAKCFSSNLNQLSSVKSGAINNKKEIGQIISLYNSQGILLLRTYNGKLHDDITKYSDFVTLHNLNKNENDNNNTLCTKSEDEIEYVLEINGLHFGITKAPWYLDKIEKSCS